MREIASVREGKIDQRRRFAHLGVFLSGFTTHYYPYYSPHTLATRDLHVRFALRRIWNVRGVVLLVACCSWVCLASCCSWVCLASCFLFVGVSC